MADSLFDPWCSGQEVSEKTKALRLLESNSEKQAAVVTALQSLVPTHYCKPAVIKKWLNKWGYEKTLKAVKKDLPEEKKARSDDMGEILATEYVNRKLDFNVPVFKLRWRDHRELALRGDDIFAVRIDKKDRVHFLKGEAKSRAVLSADVVTEASAALGLHDGRPAPHTINYVVKRLYDLGDDDLAEAIEEHLSGKSIPRKRVTHLLFVFCGNNPTNHLKKHYESYDGSVQRIVVGLRVKEHGNFIKRVFDGVKLA